MPEDIRNQLLGVIEIGRAAYVKLRKECLVEKSIRFSEPIHRTNLRTFHSIHKPVKCGKGSRKLSKTTDQRCQQRVIEVARDRGIPIEELLQYDLTTSSYLFYCMGMMKKSAKSSLVSEIKEKFPEKNIQTPQTNDCSHTTYIVDMMASVRKMKTKHLRTFGDFCDAALNYVKMSANYANRIDLIFD